MEKIIRIVIVFALLMLVVNRFIRGREPRYRPYDYLTRRKPPLPVVVEQRLIAAVFGPLEGMGDHPAVLQADALLVDAVNQLLFCYSAAGSLTILRQQAQGHYREMQSLAVPLNCTGMALDPEESKLYFEAEGYLFVYGAS